MGNPLQSVLKQGILPFLMGKMGLQDPLVNAGQNPLGQQQPTAQQTPQTPPVQQKPMIPAQTPANPSGGAPSGGAQPASSMPVPQVGYNTSGATGSLAPPTPQPISKINGLQSLLMQWNQRKDQKQQSEAANIAQNLMQAIQSNDVAMVHEILNDKHATKVLDKVYKGWLQKAQEAQKPGEPPDPTQAGFESGLQAFIQGKGKQPEMPKRMGGYQLPQASPQKQFDTAKMNAAVTQAQQDPNIMKPTQLTSEEERKKQLSAGPEKVDAELAAARAKLVAAQATVDKANYEAQKAQTEYLREQVKGQNEGKRDEARLAELNAQVRAKNLQVDIENARFQREKMKTQNINMATKADQHKMSMLTQAEKMLGQPQFTLSNQNVSALSALLRQAGATSIAKALDDDAKRGFMNVHFGSGRTYKTNQDLLDAISTYKGGLTGKAVEKEAKSDDESEDLGDATPISADDPKEGDIVDGYRFKGGDPAVQDNWEEVPPEKK